MNTKQDYINLKDTDAGKRALKSLLNNRYIWKNTAVITDEGTEDSTHRVVEDDDVKIQQEYVEDPNALIFRLGFTVDEVTELIGE